MENDSERMQPRGCVKTNDFELIQTYWDKEKTKTRCKIYLDQNRNQVGICKHWYENGQIRTIYNAIKAIPQGKSQIWNENGKRLFIITEHRRKGDHGTQIVFK